MAIVLGVCGSLARTPTICPQGAYGRLRMLRRSTPTRTAAAVLAAGLGLAMVTAVAPAAAAPGSSASAGSSAAASEIKATGPYAAASDVSLLTVDLEALSPAILPLTNLDIARSQAHLESDQDVDLDKAGTQRTAASAATTGESHLLGAAVSIQENAASAPAAEANEDVLLPLDLSPLLNIPVVRTTALANWISDTECVDADTPLSYADQALADLTLLGGEQLGGSVAELNTEDAEGAADAEAGTYLVSIPGQNDPRAVQARVRTDITSANVLSGLAGPGSVIEADVIQNPDYKVTASGIPGGASVTGPDPAVEVSIGGTPIATVVAGNDPVDAELLDLDLVGLLDLDSQLPGLIQQAIEDVLGTDVIPAELLTALDDAVNTILAEAAPIARISIPLEKVVEPDGTEASVQGSLLRVEVLPPDVISEAETIAVIGPQVADVLQTLLGGLGLDVDEPLAAVNVAPFGASVVAPAGGITCGEPNNPLRELNKHASALEVAPGGTFEYNIAVPNRGPCTVKGVTVTDVVTGPAGFQIVDTEPDGTIDGGKVSFNLGDLAPNETKNITLTIKVPADAKNGDTFDDVVTATGTCDGRTVTKDDRVDDTPTVRTDFTGPCNVSFSNKDASHIQVTKGQTFSYYVHAFNSGGEDCSNVKITDTLDSRVTFVSCNKGCTNSPADKVNWTLTNLPAGSSAILSVVVKVKDDASGTLANTAIIDPENGPPTTVSTKGPVIGPDSIPKDPAPASRHPLPKTGGVLPASVGLALGAAALIARAVRRRSAIV